MTSDLRVEVLPSEGPVHYGMPCTLRLIEPKFPKHYRLSWDSHLFLALSPYLQGIRAHLVILCTPEPQPLHIQVDLLAEVEGHHANSLHYVAPLRITAPELPKSRQPPNPTPHLLAPLRHTAINKLFSIVGSPTGRGNWLARRLTPHFGLTGLTHSFRSGVQHWISV